jgi:hypothetical protein
MSASSMITVIGISVLIVYGVTKILEFYSIGSNVYGSYIAFYFFMLISYYVLPRDYFNIK